MRKCWTGVHRMRTEFRVQSAVLVGILRIPLIIRVTERGGGELVRLFCRRSDGRAIRGSPLRQTRASLPLQGKVARSAGRGRTPLPPADAMNGVPTMEFDPHNLPSALCTLPSALCTLHSALYSTLVKNRISPSPAIMLWMSAMSSPTSSVSW